MARKRWTPKEEISEALLKFRAKRKWQIALRRYIIERNPCLSYAPYFGLDIKKFREWIEIQFDEELSWENFSKKWQFDHIVPVAYFDFDSKSDLRLCWNFMNVRVEKLGLNRTSMPRPDIFAAKRFFKTLYEKTKYVPALLMIRKIDQIESPGIESSLQQQDFINRNKDYLNEIVDFSDYEFDKLNYGTSLDEIFKEKELLRKYQ